ncbi:MAG: tryptophan-rich sensory protein [Clostridiales bacterium]|nr:tryptophan-rich sensory protein [Clostridiales bacterium]
MKNSVSRVISILLPIVLVAVLGSIFVNLGMDWFDSLEKPSQWIPNVIIPIVWSVIYITFAVILIRWQSEEDIPVAIRVLLIINGVLNVVWCLVFFTLKLTFIGNIVIILNLIFAIALWINIFSQKKVYAYILSIYPIWLSIATTLNTAIWILN